MVASVDAPEPQSGFDLAMDIAEGLARRSIAVEINGKEILDLNRPITKDASVRLLTVSNDDPAALSVLRHSCAHVLPKQSANSTPAPSLPMAHPLKMVSFMTWPLPSLFLRQTSKKSKRS